MDSASPVLLDSLHTHAASVGLDIYAVSSTTNDMTHYTRLDSEVDFDIGRRSMLADMAAPPMYPTQYFSVVWKGFLKAPSSSLYRIHIETFEAAFHEFQLGDSTRIVSEF